MTEGPDYEVRDVRPLWIVIFSVGLIASLVVVLLVLQATMRGPWQGADTSVSSRGFFDNPLQPPLGPRLQSHPEQDLREVMDEVRSRLNTYGWVDKSQGIVHLPIERAIDLTVKRGLPKQPPSKPQPLPEIQGP